MDLPHSRKIAVVDRHSRTVVANWSTGARLANYAMTLDEEHHRLFVVCRIPARLVVLDTVSGKVVQSVPVVGDADDVSYDRKRQLMYPTGRDGAASVVRQQDPDHYTQTDPERRAPYALPSWKALFLFPALAQQYSQLRLQNTLTTTNASIEDPLWENCISHSDNYVLLFGCHLLSWSRAAMHRFLGHQTAPPGRAVVGGLLVATFSTLTVVPAIYAVLQRRATTTPASLNSSDPESRHYVENPA